MKNFLIRVEAGNKAEQYQVQANVQLTAEVSAMRQFFQTIDKEQRQYAIVTHVEQLRK